ncbi:MAG: group III truncated hemoglobin [Pedobacter sp.]|jgi:hemoglobin
MSKKDDIKGIDDIKIMVDVFYEKVRGDELLAPIFNFRLSTHWEPHLEKMYTFWNAALFGVKGYNGNPFMKHATMELGEEHFERWLKMFNETVNTYFEGPVAEDAKTRAAIMAGMFRHKLDQIRQHHIKPVF